MSNITGTNNSHKLVLLRMRVRECVPLLEAVRRVSTDVRVTHVLEILESVLSETTPDWDERKQRRAASGIPASVLASPFVRKQAE